MDPRRFGASPDNDTIIMTDYVMTPNSAEPIPVKKLQIETHIFLDNDPRFVAELERLIASGEHHRAYAHLLSRHKNDLGEGTRAHAMFQAAFGLLEARAL